MAPVAPVAPSAGGNLIYSFVAVVKGSKGDKEDKGEPVVLAEHAAFAGNFKDIALECLKQVVANLGQEVDGQKKVFIPHEQHTFSFLFDDGYGKGWSIMGLENKNRRLIFICKLQTGGNRSCTLLLILVP